MWEYLLRNWEIKQAKSIAHLSNSDEHENIDKKVPGCNLSKARCSLLMALSFILTQYALPGLYQSLPCHY